MNDRLPGLKFSAFGLVCLLCAGWLISVTGNIRYFTSTHPYEAVLEDATGIAKRDSVLLAGVRVGEVKHVGVERGKARVEFEVDRDVAITDTWEIGVRWRNVIGQRYFYLYPVGGGTPLEPGDRIPVEQSRVGADIGRFFERLTPLLRAIDPVQQNKLMAALNEALVGQEERTQALIADLGSLTSTLSTREAQIRTVVQEGGALLGAYARRDQELRDFLDDLASVSSTLNARNDELIGAVTDIGAAQEELAALLQANEADIGQLVGNLDDITSRISGNRDAFERSVATLKDGLAVYMLISRWGQWFNVRAVAVQVQNEGDTVCVTEGNTPCSVPNSRSAAASSRVPSRSPALPRVMSLALSGIGPAPAAVVSTTLGPADGLSTDGRAP